MAYEILKPEWGAQRPIHGVLFDMDGLVVDTEKLFTRFWVEASQFYGFPMTRQQALGMRALSGTAGEKQLHSYFGPCADYRRIRAKRIELMDAFISSNGVEPKPGIRELLEYLQERQIPCAIPVLLRWSESADIWNHWDYTGILIKFSAAMTYQMENRHQIFICTVRLRWD